MDWQLLTTPNPLSLTIVFLFGSLIGSFLNVVIYRLPLDRSIVRPGSACVLCGTPLKAWQNVPILSYFVLGGRCHVCGAAYSARYALIELFVAAAATFLYPFFGWGWAFFYYFAFVCLVTAVFFTDLDHWIIPDSLNLFGMFFGVVGSLWLPARMDLGEWTSDLGSAGNPISSVVGVVAGALFFWAIQVIGTMLARQEAMGGGDVKFAAMIGAFLGWQLAYVSFLLSFLLGAILALPLMLSGRGRGKDPIPFGTFMALASLPVVLYGDELILWFLRLPEFLYGPV